MRQLKPLPEGLKLAPTLAQRICQLRELRNMTVKDLSRLSRFPQKRLEEIECGFESWLSTADRQLLAKALVVEPALLQEVEARPEISDHLERDLALRALSDKILNGQRDLECPDCKMSLKASVQEGLDIEGSPVHFAKAFCTSCPFVLK